MMLTGFPWLERHAAVEPLWLVDPLSVSPSTVSILQAEPDPNHSYVPSTSPGIWCIVHAQ